MIIALCVAGANTAAAEDKTLKIAYVEWSSEVASANLVKAAIELKLGVKCRINPYTAPVMWQSVGSGDDDAMVAAWLPTTHGHYLDMVEGKVEDLGPNLEGTRIGLVVPQSLRTSEGKTIEIDSIGDLKGKAELFSSRIVGIDPGAGIMAKTEEAIKSYSLQEYELIDGSGAAMTAELAEAIKEKAPIVITGWTPHWMWAKWQLKYLKDPKGIYGAKEKIHTIVRNGLKKEAPKVYDFLDRFSWAPEQMAELMIWNQEEGADPLENAKRWIKENSDQVDSWFQ
jgi:glycine betaine/proline transport system substrate-binding protein